MHPLSKLTVLARCSRKRELAHQRELDLSFHDLSRDTGLVGEGRAGCLGAALCICRTSASHVGCSGLGCSPFVRSTRAVGSLSSQLPLGGVPDSHFLRDIALSVDCPSFLSLALVVWLWESCLTLRAFRVCKIRVSTLDWVL